MKVNVDFEFMRPLIGTVPFPRIVRMEQSFDPAHIEEAHIEELVYTQLIHSERFQTIRSEQRIAITCGSRGLDGYVQMTRAVVRAVKSRGAIPFLVPAMGSHGGASADGQAEMVRTLGITEESVGAPIISSMEVDQLAFIADGRPVFLDRAAHQADGIILINRIKCHTGFRGKYESGLMKMMAIGLGKREGAKFYHQTGYGQMHTTIEEVGAAILEHANIICGVAQIENSFGKAAHIEVVDSNRIIDREPELLHMANSYLPKLPFAKLDVCCIQKIGKNISGTGFDHNILGRFPDHPEIGTSVTRLAILDLTEISHGNGSAMGRADIITQRFLDKTELSQIYPNAITSTSIDSAKIPLIVPTDRDALTVGIRTSFLVDFCTARIAFVESTKNMKVFYASENLVDEALSNGASVVGTPFEIPYDTDGTLKLGYI